VVEEELGGWIVKVGLFGAVVAEEFTNPNAGESTSSSSDNSNPQSSSSDQEDIVGKAKAGQRGRTGIPRFGSSKGHSFSPEPLL